MEENDVEVSIKMKEGNELSEVCLKKNTGGFITWPDIIQMSLDCLRALSFSISEEVEILLEEIKEGNSKKILEAYNSSNDNID